jgi:hypothetical protein
MQVESAHREILRVLLERLFELGLLSKSACQGAEDLVYSMIDFPDFFGDPALPRKEADSVAGTYDSCPDAHGKINL